MTGADLRATWQLAAAVKCPIPGCEWMVIGGGACADHGGSWDRPQSLTDAFGNTRYRIRTDAASPQCCCYRRSR